jgi:hypothetical protein
MADFTFPAILPTDSDDVVLALKSARSLWDAADYAQATRWLRKAATAAEEAGNDQRSLDLAKKASDVESAGQQQQASAEPPYVQAIRVAVKRSIKDGELFVARLLETQPVPHGSHEAFLVLTNPNVDLFDPSAS